MRFHRRTLGTFGLLALGVSALAILPSSVDAQDATSETTITSGVAGPSQTVQLDAAGFRVFTAYTDGSLEVVHCRDASCSSASRTFPDPDDEVTGRFGSSLVLDAHGFPVISYYGIATADLRIMHCNDPDCAGNDESITAPVPDGVTGQHSALVLDSSGNPVVAYYDTTRGRLGIVRCDDPNCAGVETPVHPDPDRVTGRFDKSIVLDDRGNPVVTYFDVTNEKWKLLRCGTPDCSGPVRVIRSTDYPPTDVASPPTTVPADPDMMLPVTGPSPWSPHAPIVLLLVGMVLVAASRAATLRR